MWRSLAAARASLSSRAARNLLGAPPPAQSLSPSAPLSAARASPSRLRFFSADFGDRDSIPSESTVSVQAFGENGGDGAQLDDFAKFGEIESPQLEDFAKLADIESAQLDESGEQRFETLVSLLRSSSDGFTESDFDGLGLSFSEEIAVRVLEIPEISSGNLIGLFRWALKAKPEFAATPLVVESLVLAVCKNGLSKKCAYSLWDLVKEISEKDGGSVTPESLNNLIALLSKLGKAKAAIEVFDKFGDFGIEPNADTFYVTVEALCRRSMFDWASSYCRKMVSAERVPDGERVGKIISWLCKGKMAKDAHSVYALAKAKKQLPPRSSVDLLVGSLCRNDDTVRLALEVLSDFEGEARKYAIKPFSAAIQGLCRVKDVAEAKKLLLEMATSGPPPGNAAFNSVIHGYCKVGEMAEAVETMKLMKGRGLKPDVYTYTVVISGYTNGGQMAEALGILAEAKKQHSKLSPVTYHTLIRGFCRLEAFDKALELLAEMKSHGVEANADEYNKLIQSLCLKALDWGTAEKLVEEMKDKGLHLNGITRSLVRAVKEMEEEAGAAKI